jgi:hypothetical protein
MNVRYFIEATRYTATGVNREGKLSQLFRRDRIDVDPSPAAVEADVAVNQREDGVIAAKADVLSGKKLCSALADDDIAGHDQLAAESFYTKPFADAVAAILNAALSFFVCHWKKLKG